MLVGYARVSTLEQILALQQDALTEAGCERLFTDTASGSISERPGLSEALDFARPGDTLVVWRLDRLGRSLRHLIDTVSLLQERGIGFKSLFVGIVGPSGSGKSSLLYAGLLPRLQRLHERWVVLPAVRPGQHPIKNLARSLTQAFAVRGQSFSPDELAALLERGPVELTELADDLAETAGDSKVLVVIDQAEELITRTEAHEQQRFLGLLNGALANTSLLWAVATVRSEFLSTAPERAGLAEVIDDSLLVEPLSWNRMSEVMQRPAQQAGLEFAPGLVERMVNETTGGDALPLLTLQGCTKVPGQRPPS